MRPIHRAMVALAATSAIFATILGSAPAVPGADLLSRFTAHHPERLDEAQAAAQYAAERTGEIDPAVMQQAELEARSQAAKIRIASGMFGHGWKELGPKPYVTNDPQYNDAYAGTSGLGWGTVSGRATAVAIDPNDSTGNTIWLGTAGGGVWVTRDAGTHWKPVWDNQETMAVGAIAFDKIKTRTMYVGTGESNYAGTSMFRGLGVYRSTDDGRSFTRVAHNVNADVIGHIEALGGHVFVASDKGLWLSKDAGNSYADVRLPTNEAGTAPYNGPWGNIVTDVRIKPGDPTEVTAAVGSVWGKANSQGNGLYRSNRGGAPGTWTRMDAANTALSSGSVSNDPLGRITLAYATGQSEDHNILWALVQDPGLQQGKLKDNLDDSGAIATALNGVYRSGDDGASWTLKATPQSFDIAPGSGLLANQPFYTPGVQAWYNQWLLVSPSNPTTVFVGLEEIYQSTQNADSSASPAVWTTVGRYWNGCTPVNVDCGTVPVGPYAGSTTHPDQHAAALSDDGSKLYAANDGGLFAQQSTTGSFTNTAWTSLNSGLGTTQPYFAAVANDGVVYAGFQDNGTAKIDQANNNYAAEVFGGDGGDVAVDPNNSQNVYEEYVNGTVSVSTNGGKMWTNIAPNITTPQFIAPFKMDPQDSNHLVLGAHEIVETVKGTSTLCPNDFVVTGTHIAVSAQGQKQAVCDWKTSYTLGSNGTTPYSTTALDVNGTTIYAGYCGLCSPSQTDPSTASSFHSGIATNFLPGCTPAEQANTCWHDASAKGLPNRLITSITMDPSNPKTVYVTLAGYRRRWVPLSSKTPNIGKGHVFVSHNGGQSFKDISANLPDAPAESIAVLGNRLFVAMHAGVYTTSHAGGQWEHLGTGFPNTYPMDVRVAPDGTSLIVATHGRGVWKYALTRLVSASASLSAGGVGGRSSAHRVAQKNTTTHSTMSARNAGSRARSTIPIAAAIALIALMSAVLTRRRKLAGF